MNKYITVLQSLITQITIDQKDALTDNRQPIAIAERIQLLESVIDVIREAQVSINQLSPKS